MKHVSRTRWFGASLGWLFVLLLLSTGSWSFADSPAMVAHFIDVGQADATLLEFPCGVAMIDAGAQDKARADKLVAYLDDFFDRRADLNNTIDVLFITHSHADHNSALRKVVERFRVRHYVDNANQEGDADWVRKAATAEKPICIREVSDNEVVSAGSKTGLSDDEIDPIGCETCDPRIAVLSGGLEENPGWGVRTFSNQNNQSLVIRVDFGESSFLFTGDLEKAALETLLNYYEDQLKCPELLDTDVYHVGHHGAANATTEELLDDVTPQIAVISMGNWKESGSRTASSYGHPTVKAINLLRPKVADRRDPSKYVHVFRKKEECTQTKISEAIYGTGWDGPVDIRATADGVLSVTVGGKERPGQHGLAGGVSGLSGRRRCSNPPDACLRARRPAMRFGWTAGAMSGIKCPVASLWVAPTSRMRWGT